MRVLSYKDQGLVVGYVGRCESQLVCFLETADSFLHARLIPGWVGVGGEGGEGVGDGRREVMAFSMRVWGETSC